MLGDVHPVRQLLLAEPLAFALLGDSSPDSFHIGVFVLAVSHLVASLLAVSRLVHDGCHTYVQCTAVPPRYRNMRMLCWGAATEGIVRP